MTLLDLAAGERAEIAAVRGDVAVTRRMHALGIIEGRAVRLVRAAPFSGPLLIEDEATGARVMIARAMAAGVEVRREPKLP